MVRFSTFNGLRYDTSLVSMKEVIAPPYDVVDAQGRSELASASPYNSILLELPEENPSRGDDRYQVAASLLAEWIQKGVVKRDVVPSFYGYRMQYVDELGVTRTTTGVLGALGLEGSAEGTILPHEETMPKPKGDRLFLLRATRTNLSPIWGLSLASGLSELCEPGSDSGTRGVPDEMVSAVDVDGITHSLWPITDGARCDAISNMVESAPIVIADGHHRFETALAYSKERHEAGEESSGDSAVFGFVVELAPEQLLVRPIHRLVSGLAQGTNVFELFAGHFAAEQIQIDPAELNPAMLSQEGAIALVTRDGAWYLRDSATATSGGTPGDVLAELDSVRLRNVLDDLPGHEIEYEPRWPVALEAVRSGAADFVVMIRAVTVDQIGRAAHARLRMPPKTTYFHPKPRTGMVFRPLD